MKRARSNRVRQPVGKWLKWMLPAMALLVAAAGFLVVSFITGETQVKLEEPVYQYFMEQRVEYEAGTKLLPGEYHVIFSSGEEENAGDATPIYCTQSTALILAKDMSWTDPSTGIEWRVPMFSRLEIDRNGAIWCQLGNRRINMGGGILHDGAGTFLFLDTVQLMVNDRKYTLPPFSFCSTITERTRIYSYGEEKLITINDRKTNIVITAVERAYRVDLTRGLYTSAQGENWLLSASPKAMPELGA